jgi:hypothetical protein
MATTTPSEAEILGRVIDPGKPLLSRAAAGSLVALEFAPDDKAAMQELAARARAGVLTPEDERAIEAYGRVGSLISILHAKARMTLNGTRTRRTH